MKKNHVRRSSRYFCYPAALLAAVSVSTLSLNAGLALQPVAEGLVQPTALVSMGADNSGLLIADQAGLIYLHKDGKLQEEPVMDLRSRIVEQNQGFDERGLLGLALHPNFSENGKFYVYYSAPGRASMPEGWNHTSHISEFTMMPGNREKADPDSERILMQVDQPQPTHNCGRLTFGPDGFLYIALGDGGGANDGGGNVRQNFKIGHSEGGNAQDITKPLGKILRIDVNGDPFNIPSDNPFVDKEGLDTIFAFGLRNPWSMSFDRGGNHDLFVGDIGQNLFEEVNIVTKGGNYGWRIREGFHGFDPARDRDPNTTAPKVDAMGNQLIDPILEYKNMGGFRQDPEAMGISITGGYVYRGKAIPELEGQYIFADWSTSFALPNGVVFAAKKEGDTWTMRKLELDGYTDSNIGVFVVAFGEDADGELYILGNKTNGLLGATQPEFKQGIVYKLVKTE